LIELKAKEKEMSYRKAVVLAVIGLLAATAYDAWWVFSGRFGTDGYLPGIYPIFCVLVIVGLRITKTRGLWGSSPKP
jgi:hypothetical protein